MSLGLGVWLCFSGLPQGSSHRREESHSPFPLASPVIASHSWAGAAGRGSPGWKVPCWRLNLGL